MPQAERDNARSNRLPVALETASRERIAAYLRSIRLKLGAVVCEAGGLLKDAYFPQGNALSVLKVLETGPQIETANMGREGAFGLFGNVYARALARNPGR